MKIDITSMFFNSKIEGQTATPAWGTSIGQNKSRDCRIDDFKKDVIDMVVGMTYKSVTDLSSLDVSKGSGNRDIITCSVFNNVYINNKKIENAQYVLLLVREHSKNHDGRLLICYAPYIKYNGIDNQSCIDLMRQQLGCSPEGCWFVYDISIKNQSELYFSAVVVNASAPMNYSKTIKSKNRSEEWKALIPADLTYAPMLSDFPLQQIFYGAPGTGKSFKIDKDTKGHAVIRTTFHPDSDYSTFVGAYKPVMEDVEKQVVPVVFNNSTFGFDTNNGNFKERCIAYKFVKQAFTKAYLSSWRKYVEDPESPQPQFLVIEEINRGNCAQIFGDLFQLLDRSDNGFSSYPIEADTDLQKEVARSFKEDEEYKLSSNISIEGAVKDYTSNYEATLSEDVQEGRILLLPPNLYIWATMNTSDQSLFPIDSAFKRRWDWVYIPISASDEDNFGIKVGKHFYDWGKFISRMNLVVADVTSSEDKQLGYYFCKADEGGNIISANRFVNKVLFYLWNDVFKNYGFEAKLDGKDVFKYKNDEGKDDTMSFTSFYISNGLPNVKQIKRLMDNLGLEGFNEWPAGKAEENTNDGTAKLLSVTYNDNVVDGASNKEIFVKTLELIIKDRDADEVAKVIGIEMTKNPPSQSETTRDYKKVGDSDWYVATNNGKGKFLRHLINLANNLELNLVAQ